MGTEDVSEPQSPSVSSDIHGRPPAHALLAALFIRYMQARPSPSFRRGGLRSPEVVVVVVVAYVVQGRSLHTNQPLCLAEGSVQNDAGWRHRVALGDHLVCLCSESGKNSI